MKSWVSIIIALMLGCGDLAALGCEGCHVRASNRQIFRIRQAERWSGQRVSMQGIFWVPICSQSRRLCTAPSAPAQIASHSVAFCHRKHFFSSILVEVKRRGFGEMLRELKEVAMVTGWDADPTQLQIAGRPHISWWWRPWKEVVLGWDTGYG